MVLIIKDIRLSKNLTLDELAAQSGVSKRTISAYESNETDPRLSTLQKIASALGVHYAELSNDKFDKAKLINQDGNVNLYKSNAYGKINNKINDQQINQKMITDLIKLKTENDLLKSQLNKLQEKYDELIKQLINRN